MEKLSDKKAFVIGYGVFEVFIAQKLAEEFKEVRIYTPCEEAFPTVEKQWIGKGVPGIVRVDNFEDSIPEMDLFVFPDYGFASKQEMLRKAGKRVFGVNDILEMDRILFAKTLSARGLPVFKYRPVKGIDGLRAILKKEKDLWVKLPTKVRGLMETFHHEEYKNSITLLDELAHKLGPVRDILDFMVVDPVLGVEIGYEEFLSNGDNLGIAAWGPEVKGAGYIGRIMPISEMPKAITKTETGMAPVWKKYKMCGHISMEIREGKDRIPYPTDPCLRFASPPGEAILQSYKNVPQIFWAVGGGEKIKPEKVGEYVAEVCIYSLSAKNEALPVDFPEKEFKRLKFRRLCKIEGQYYVLPDPLSGDRIAGAVGVGNTKEEAQFEALEACEVLKCRGKDYRKDVFEEADEVLDEAKKYGISF